MMDKRVTISLTEYEYLLDRLGFLRLLEMCGIEKCEEYKQAVQIYEKTKDDE